VVTGVLLLIGTAMFVGIGTVTGTTNIVPSATKAFMAGFARSMVIVDK
jgi:hypothetical protein